MAPGVAPGAAPAAASGTTPDDAPRSTLGAAPATGGDRSGRLVILGCFLVAIYAWGLGFYGQAVYLAELQRLRGWSTATVSGAVSFYFLAGAILFSLVPPAIARHGARVVMIAGVCATAAGVATLPAVDRPWLLYPTNLLMAFGWATTSGTAISIVLAQWYVARRGLAISMALNGASAAGFVGVPLMIASIAALGFADGLRLYVVLAALAATLAIVALIRRPVSGGGATAAPAGDAPMQALAAHESPDSRAQTLRSPRFWAIAAPFGLAFAAQVGFLTHQVAFLLPIGGKSLAASIVAATSVAAVVGRVALGLVVDRLEVRAVSSVVISMQALAFTAMTIWQALPILIVACVVFGLGLGSLITLPSLVVQREFSAASFAVVVALVMTVVQITYALGPIVLGLLRDLAGGYGPVLAGCAVLDLFAAAVLWRGRRFAPRRAVAR